MLPVRVTYENTDRSSVYRTISLLWMPRMRESRRDPHAYRQFIDPSTSSYPSKKVISGLLKPMSADLKSRYISLKDGQVMSEISKAKAQEESPERLRGRAKALGSKGEILSIIADVSQPDRGCKDKTEGVHLQYNLFTFCSDLPKV